MIMITRYVGTSMMPMMPDLPIPIAAPLPVPPRRISAQATVSQLAKVVSRIGKLVQAKVMQVGPSVDPSLMQVVKEYPDSVMVDRAPLRSAKSYVVHVNNQDAQPPPHLMAYAPTGCTPIIPTCLLPDMTRGGLVAVRRSLSADGLLTRKNYEA